MNRVMIGLALCAAGLTMFSRSGARIRAHRAAQDKEDLARWEEEGGAPVAPFHGMQAPAGHATPSAT